ncbi:MAG: hypothetical protein ACI8RE_002025 [Ilumatobacter sp.]|jgi:hypothetical protein
MAWASPRDPIFDGVESEADLLIYAIGFEVQQTSIYDQIVGVSDIDLNDKEDSGIRTMLGIEADMDAHFVFTSG